jgi:hypothetical protein
MENRRVARGEAAKELTRLGVCAEWRVQCALKTGTFSK